MTVQTTAKHAEANGLRISYEEHGTGHPLLLLSGGFGTHRVWDAQVPAWQSHFRVIAPDARGLGRTEHPGGPISYELLAKDVLALIDSLHLEKPLVCGFNDGACVALQMAIWAPERAAAFVFMDAWLWNAKQESQRGLALMQELFGLDGPVRDQLTDDDLARIEQVNHPAIGFLQSGYPEGSTSNRWKSYLKHVWPAWSMLTEHGSEDLQRITTPTLVVVGDRDPFQPLHEAVELYSHLPNAELAVIPGMDNGGPLSNRADLLNQVVLSFLLRQTESAPPPPLAR